MFPQDENGSWVEWSKFVISELRRLADESHHAREHHEKTNSLLHEYNMQLQLHIAGVQALDKKTDLLKDQIGHFKLETEKRFQLQEQIDSFKKETEKRLDAAELPASWFKTTGSILSWIGAAAAVVGAAYAVYQFFK